jgi:hypothetical protein
MKTDRLQGIIISYGDSSTASRQSHPYIKRLLGLSKKLHIGHHHEQVLEQRYIETRGDYAELIAADLLERLRHERH